MKYSKLEKLEKPLEFGVGLSSNSLHASEFMAVGGKFDWTTIRFLV
jgi:hypothetical protein